jgi:hypothetical protein
LGASSRPCLMKTTRRTVLWHPEQLKVWCSKPRTARSLAARPPIVASIEHFHPHPEVTRYGDELVVLIWLGREDLTMQAPYARTYCPRKSATPRLRRPGATTYSSCTVDACLIRGAACIGMGGLSVSRPPLMNTTRCSVTWHAEQMNVWCSTPRAATVSSGTTFARINSPPHAAQRITRTHLLGAHPGYRAG